MIRVFIRKGILGTDGRELFDLPWSAGTTPRSIALQFQALLPKSVPIEAVVNGRILGDEELDAELPDESQLLLVPITSSGIEIGVLIVQAIIAATVAFAVNYVMSLLIPRPKAPGLPAERGDQSSATYAWDGITTNYGQGFPVPFVYGRHGVGGQVIFTDLFSTTASAAPADKLRIVLALSEGPIAAIGDTEADELDNLGETGTTLPSEIRIDNNLLDNTDTGISVRRFRLGLWSGPQPAGEGDTLHVYDSTITTLLGTVQVLTFNNAQRTDIDTVVITGSTTLGAAGNVIRNLNAASIGQATVTTVTTELRLNQEPGARAWIRPGTLDQDPLPGTTFRGSSKTFSPNEQLTGAGDTATYSYFGTERMTTVGFVVAFPGGLYATDAQGNTLPYTVQVEVAWRPAGTTAWRTFFRPQGNGARLQPRSITANSLGQILDTFGGDLVQPGGQPVSGPIEVRLQRNSAAGGTDTSSSMLWRNVFFNTDHTLAYPRVALLGLELSAGSRFSGSIPNVQIRIDGIKVRVWDETDGWSDRCWDVPAAPFNFMTHAPGRNPAWILLDLLLAPWGLGKYLTEDDIDLPAFRRWAAFCDSDPSPSEPWGTPAFTCDFVGDVIRPAQEWIILICACGRAAPVEIDGKISVVYHYRDAHGDAGVSVPAKTVTQLFTSGNVEQFQVTWLPKASRFTVNDYQFLDEEQAYAHAMCRVRDEEAALDDPASLNPDYWRPQTIQAFGVTRRPQLWREGVYAHRVTRLIRREITFRTGPWALAATVGDLISVEHETMRPFSTDVPMSMCVVEDATAATEVFVDHNPAGATQVVLRGEDGAPITRTVTGTNYAGGVGKLVLSGAAVTVKAGSPCVVGLADKLTQDYEVIAISLQEDMKREVRALQWVPEIYDELTPTQYANSDPTATPENLLRQPEQNPLTEIEGLRATRVRSGVTAITWAKPPHREQASTRVYAQASDRGTWELLGETAGSTFMWEGASAGTSYVVAVTMELAEGGWQTPESGAQLEFTAEEFGPWQPPPISSLTATDVGDAVVLKWDRLAAPDVDGYEARIGTCWTSGVPLFDTAAPTFRLEGAPLGGTLMLAARAPNGMFGQPVTVEMPEWRPLGTAQVVALDDFAGTPGGTHSGTAFAGGKISLTAGTLAGTYTATAIDIGYEAEAYWQVVTDQEEVSQETIDDLGEATVESGEARWRTVHGRPASPAFPAADWDLTIDDADWTIDDTPGNVRVNGENGEPGSNTQILVESRWHVGGAWGDWELHTDRWRVARQMQTRVTLRRDATDYEPSLTDLRTAANL